MFVEDISLDYAFSSFPEGVAAYQKIGYEIYEKQLPGCEGAAFLYQHCGYEEQAKLRRLLIEKARCVIILMDSTKFGKMLPYTFAKMEDVNYLITDQTSSPMLLADAERNNVTVL